MSSHGSTIPRATFPCERRNVLKQWIWKRYVHPWTAVSEGRLTFFRNASSSSIQEAIKTINWPFLRKNFPTCLFGCFFCKCVLYFSFNLVFGGQNRVQSLTRVFFGPDFSFITPLSLSFVVSFWSSSLCHRGRPFKSKSVSPYVFYTFQLFCSIEDFALGVNSVTSRVLSSSLKKVGYKLLVMVHWLPFTTTCTTTVKTLIYS